MPTRVYNIKYDLSGIDRAMHNRFGKGSNGQFFWTNQIYVGMEKYTPMLTGALRDSPKQPGAPPFSDGVIVYNTPYARRQYYENPGPPRPSGALRGPRWPERAKDDLYPLWVSALQREVESGNI